MVDDVEEGGVAGSLRRDGEFDQLVECALDEPFEGWDFGVFAGRYVEAEPPWDYRTLVRRRLAEASALVDMGTGGGELLAEFEPLPARTVATEGFPPNVPVARARLEPLGVELVEVDDSGRLPFDDGAFDLVVNRHEAFDASEVRRVLRPGGVFITQQVGGRDLYELNEALGGPAHLHRRWDLPAACETAERGGLEVTWSDEAFPPGHFRDVGAIVLFLRISPWQIPDFSVHSYREPLRDLHERIGREGPFEVTCHRFVIAARRPA